jgi:hypothetical protein
VNKYLIFKQTDYKEMSGQVFLESDLAKVTKLWIEYVWG